MWTVARICQVGFKPDFKTAASIARNALNISAVRNQVTREVSDYSKTKTAYHVLRRKMKGSPEAAFTIGRGLALGAGATGLGALCYYGLGLSNEAGIMEKSVLWPEYVKKRIHTTFMYVGGSIGIAAIAAALALRSPTIMRISSCASIGTNLLIMGSVIGSFLLVQSIPYTPGFGLKQMSWIGFASLIGLTLAPLSFLGGPVLIRAAWNTLGIVGGLSCLAICAPSNEFLKMTGPLAMGCGLVFISGLGAMFLPPTTFVGAGMHSIFLYGGLILFSTLFLYNCQRIVKTAETIPPETKYSIERYDPINMSLSLFMDIINIFVRMVILSGSSNKKH